jgi:hypothetical protein
LKEEERKKRLFGEKHKEIHAKPEEEGIEISVVTINIALALIGKRAKEVYIRQEYDLGDRLEYDYGEVLKLNFVQLRLRGRNQTELRSVIASHGSVFVTRRKFPVGVKLELCSRRTQIRKKGCKN